MKRPKFYQNMDRETRGAWIKVILAVFIITLISVFVIPYISKLADPDIQNSLQNIVGSLGVAGWLILLLIQFAQVVIAFIPGEPVEIMAGVLYGGLGGMALCMAGIAAASALIFQISKKYGKTLIQKLFKNKNIEEFSFVQDSKKLEMTIFLLFLIPGTPKDMLTYVVGATQISLSRFLFISLIARVPSVITSTVIGSSVSKGAWKETIVVFIITALIGIAGILFKDKALHLLRHADKHIHHGKPIEISMALDSDLEMIHMCMVAASENLADPSMFIADDKEFIQSHMHERGFILKAEIEEKLAGFLLVRFPGFDLDNLGRDLCYSDKMLTGVAHMETVVVAPEFRGLRIQKKTDSRS